MKLYHGSSEKASKIVVNNSSFLYGLFASQSRTVALSHGDFLYSCEIDEDDILDLFDVDFATTKVVDYNALEDSDLDATKLVSGRGDDFDTIVDNAELIIRFLKLDNSCSWEPYELSYELQNAAARIAEEFGYKAVWLWDEHGWSAMCCPGNVFEFEFEDK